MTVSGKRVWIKPSDFSEKDRKYIKEWIVANYFLTDSKLRISIDKRTKSGQVSFALTFKNNSSHAIPDFKMKYKILIEIESYDGPDQDRWKNGSLTVGSLAPGASTMHTISSGEGGSKYKTVTVATTTYGNTTYSQEEQKVSTTYTRGVLLQLQGPPLEGVQIIRKLSEPKGLGEKHEWDTARDFDEERAKILGNRLHEREKENEVKNVDPEENPALAFNDDAAAVRAYSKALQQSQAGDPEAMLRAATMLEKGEGTPLDYGQAIEWYTSAVHSNKLEGCIGLARIYASCDDSAYHDGAKAVKFAVVVVRKNPKDVEAHLLLSAAHIRNFDQSQAVATAAKAARYATSQNQVKK